MNRFRYCVAASVLVLFSASTIAAGRQSQGSLLKSVGIDQQLGAQLNLDLHFRDESGADVTLAEYFHQKPVILAPVYYSCPSLCPMTINSLIQSLRVLEFNAGKDFEVVALSFDPSETPEIAAKAKAHYVNDYHRPGTATGFHFLTGSNDSIRAVTDTIGFHYAWDNNSNQWAHATGIMVATPDGRIGQYFYGLEYSARDLRLALVEASAGRLGSIVDHVLLYCYRYDPATGKYGMAVIRTVRVCGALTAIVLFGSMFAMFRREARTGRP